MRVTDYLVVDHRRLEELLSLARRSDAIDEDTYGRFRARLLRHIAIEEKLLFPAVAASCGGAPLPRVRALRTAHAGIAALLAPRPDLERVAELTALLAVHDAEEEGPDGVYAACEALLGDAVSAALADRARAYGEVRVAPYRTPVPKEHP